ncbi:MAG: hypothetical protein AB7P02_22730 [Alphaproteobacteria bacterium]
MKTILGAAAIMAAAAAPADAAYIEIWNLMTANPFGAQLVVEDVRYADGGVDAPSRPIGRSLNLGDGTVVAFNIVTQSASGGLAFALRCTPEAAFSRVEIENPWTVTATGACEVVSRGRIEGNMIRWE